jgi:ribosome-binding factor A
MERVAAEVRGVLGEVLSRDEIKDPRVRGAGLITVTHVRISGDLQHAGALFTVHGLDAAALERVRQGLNHASGYFRQAVSRRLRMKVAPAIKFEVDQVFEQAALVEKLLHEVAPPPPPKPSADPETDEGDDRVGEGELASPEPIAGGAGPSQGTDSDDREGPEDR